MEPIIVVKDLRKRYGDLSAVDGISFAVYENEIFGIIGPNGAGKTTTVECVEGLRDPSEGVIRILDLDPKTDAYKLRQLIGIQLQESRVPRLMKVREAMDLFASFYSRSLAVGPILEQVGLSDKANSKFESLSGGQKQRLSIALALVNDPHVVFFDELTTGLDPQARRAMWEMVSSIRAAGKTVILVTHFMEEAEQLCDRVAIVDRGRIVALNTPTNLISSIDGGLKISFTLDDSATVVTQLQNIVGATLLARNGEITIQSADDRVIGEVIRTLRENHCNFRNFTVTKPTLEDVFLSITGKEMRE